MVFKPCVYIKCKHYQEVEVEKDLSRLDRIRYCITYCNRATKFDLFQEKGGESQWNGS